MPSWLRLFNKSFGALQGRPMDTAQRLHQDVELLKRDYTDIEATYSTDSSSGYVRGYLELLVPSFLRAQEALFVVRQITLRLEAQGYAMRDSHLYPAMELMTFNIERERAIAKKGADGPLFYHKVFTRHKHPIVDATLLRFELTRLG